MSDELLQRARAWIDDDPDHDARRELEQLIADAQLDDLRDRFAATLSFGTAGLRGLIGAGPNRMNCSVAARITAGLCAHLRTTVPDATTRGVVVGFDGRRMSRAIADEVTRVALGAGFVVHGFIDVIPTPLVSHAVIQLSAAAGIMITASHNPPQYNGYKAYAHNGAQLIAPDDAAVIAAAEAIGSVIALPRVALEPALASGALRHVDREVVSSYLASLSAINHELEQAHYRVRIAYTALHGVGETFTRCALREAGFNEVHSVTEQATPDGEFPTVNFPNPEEPSALERVMALGQEVDAELVLANDPDADRLAVAARNHAGELQTLTGNQLGLLLTDFLLARCANPANAFVLSSIVTTPAVERIASAYGAHWEATLTGTKWICNRAMSLEQRGLDFVFGFEEAIGYCRGRAVRDKDGVGAAVLTALLASHHKAQGHSLHQALEALQRTHGIAASRQASFALSGTDGVERAKALLLRLVQTSPEALGERPVRQVVDLSAGGALPPTPGVILVLQDEQRVCVRPSGTEPKLKCYFDARVPLFDGERYDAALARAEQVLDTLVAAFNRLL